MDLGQYYQTKSVKLNDSYIVSIHNLKQRHWDNSSMAIDQNWDANGDLGSIFGKPADRLVEFYSCIAVELPSYKYKIESHQTGNLREKIIMPDYEAKPTFSLTFAETDDYQIDQLLNFIIRRNIKSAGCIDMEYIDNGWVDVIAVDVLNNNLNERLLRYQFGFCRLVDYEIYDLSYNSSDLPTYKMTFNFESFKKIYRPDVAEDGYNPKDIFDDTRNKVGKYQDEYNTRTSNDIADRNSEAEKDEAEMKAKKEQADKDRAARKAKASKPKSSTPPAAPAAPATPSEELAAANKQLTEANDAVKKAEDEFNKSKSALEKAFPSFDGASFSRSADAPETKAYNKAFKELETAKSAQQAALKRHSAAVAAVSPAIPSVPTGPAEIGGYSVSF